MRSHPEEQVERALRRLDAGGRADLGLVERPPGSMDDGEDFGGELVGDGDDLSSGLAHLLGALRLGDRCKLLI